MYFKNRAEAGRLLANKLLKYKSQHIVVIALGLGSSVVAAQVAMRLHANLVLYAIKDITLPGELDPLAGMGSGDVFTYNDFYTPAQIDEFASEYHSYIDQKRLESSHELHMLLGEQGEIDKSLLRRRTIILIADGLANGFALNVVADFLKTVATKKLIIATPIASVTAVDRMHLVGDELYCLGVTDNYMGVNHYYDENYVPDVPGVMKMMRNISLNWDRHSK
jgi:putative phosphoribosyl transferase